MSDLPSRIKELVGEFKSGDPKATLSGTKWRDIRQEIKQWIALLDVSGHRIVGGRLDHEYATLTEAMRKLAAENLTPPLRNFQLDDVLFELTATLHSLSSPHITQLLHPAENAKAGRGKRQRRKPVIYDSENPDAEYLNYPWYSPGMRPSLIALAYTLEQEPNRTASHSRLDGLLPSAPSKLFNDIRKFPKSLKWWETWIINNDGVYTLRSHVPDTKSSPNRNVVNAKR